MHYPDSNFSLDFSKINWIDYRPDSINQFEVASAYTDSGKEWYATHDPQSRERYFYIIGFSSKARFLFVLLKEHKDDFNRLVVERIIVADHEPQIRERYYKPKFKKR
jgi:hypothetical protein